MKSEENPFDLEGSVIMHTAVSGAGISPTTSNKIKKRWFRNIDLMKITFFDNKHMRNRVYNRS